ncbi:Bro-N domain-containing protein [Blautia hansenii]|uniref:BRO-N domain-containing protein n=1 Tax=Blautia hansenii TaxID=1322 RepID=UPI0022E150B5|nr:BRO family protein [Blautia hansenii]
MSELKIFENKEFGQVRIVMIDGEPWFCLADICRALELTNPAMVKTRLNEKGINSIDTLTKRGNQKLLYVNEANLYKTIFQSRKESAERFTDWVTSDVLPSIRKTGKYEANKNNTIIPTVVGSATQIPPLGNWYDKMKLRIDALCEIYDTSRKQLYHLILTQVQGKYSWDYAVMAYINETGSAPRYPMDVVAHFQQLQTEAENIINILLEHAGYNI